MLFTFFSGSLIYQIDCFTPQIRRGGCSRTGGTSEGESSVNISREADLRIKCEQEKRIT